MTLHLGLSHVHSRHAEQQQEAREARKVLKERVRNDWFYPPLPAYQDAISHMRTSDTKEAEERRIAGFRFHNPDDRDAEHASGLAAELDFEPLDWREREYSSESTNEEAESRTSPSKGSSPRSQQQPQLRKQSQWRFEGPDSVGEELRDQRMAQKRKRQQALDEEVRWNDGLAHWLARRDAWCGAHTSAQVHVLESGQGAHIETATTSSDSTPRSSTSASAHSAAESAGTNSTPSTTPDLEPVTTVPALPTVPSAAPSDILVPLAPRMLANHPIRRRITPSVYPEIYTKIIVQSRTPSVPINLETLTRALVQGWHDDGEWPPKQGPIEKAIGRRKGSKDGEGVLKHGVRAVGRALRITTAESSVTADKG